ncbi:MAG TPA: acylphosphatase [Clostridia bacterium]|nr:acylphosphatase [Clostridia bacterium]
MIRKHVYVSGKVQGVYFRVFTEKAARKYGVKGWVRNMSDGRVEAVVEGEKDSVGKMLQWFWSGSPYSKVDGVEEQDVEHTGEFKTFSIRY